jgi:hypothetical protein
VHRQRTLGGSSSYRQMPGSAGTIGSLDEHFVPAPERMLLIGVNSCRKLLSVSIDITSNAHTATCRLYIFGQEARSCLPRLRVSTAAGSFSSCRTNRGNRMGRPRECDGVCSGRPKRDREIWSNYFVRQRTFASSWAYRQTLRPGIRFKSDWPYERIQQNLSAKVKRHGHRSLY